MKMKLASGGGSRSASKDEDDFVDVGGVRLLARRVDDLSGGDLRNLADTFRGRIKSGVVLLGSVMDGKATLLAAVTDDLTSRISASTIISRLAPIVGGKGGGKADLAQAGGKDPARMDEAIAEAGRALQEILGA